MTETLAIDAFPAAVTREQMRAAFDALGLPADAWNRTRSIEIHPFGATVTLFRHNENGRCWMAGDEPATRFLHLDRR